MKKHFEVDRVLKSKITKCRCFHFRCDPGYSEALFSSKCVPDSECRDHWALVLVVFLAAAYAGFLLFQKNLKDFLLGAPLGAKSLKQWKGEHEKVRDTNMAGDGVNWDAPRTQEEQDEGGIFLILLFYYFQDAAVVHTNTIYVDDDSALVNSVKQIVGGIFKFRLDVLHLANSVCAVSGLTPSVKIAFKLVFVPMVLGILVFIYVLSTFCETVRPRSRIWNFLARRSALAIMFAVLFSYQKLASSLFTLVRCVSMEGDTVLFVDAEVTCYTPAQVVVFLILIFSICPFSFYIALSPALMKKRFASLGEFFLGCLLPLPMAVYWGIKYGVLKKSKVRPDDDAASVYKLLQGPYREFELPGIFRYICWAGVLLGRRLCLVLAATFISDVIVRLSVMMAVCQFSLLHTVFTRPCKERRGNVAGIVSGAALLIVCTVNFLRAAYESAEYVPTGSNLTLMKVFDQVENSLLIWIPLAGVIIIFCVLVGRLVAKLILRVLRPKGAEVTPEGSEREARPRETKQPVSMTPVQS